MMKWIKYGLILAVATPVLMFGAKMAGVSSYVSTAWNNWTQEAKDAIPTKFELERIRNEIAALDVDIRDMARPIAEQKAVIDKLSKDVKRDEDKLAEQKKTLLDIATDLEGSSTTVLVGNKQMNVDLVRKQLERDTEALQKFDLRIKAQKKIVAAKEEALRATQDQLAKIVSKKRDYEVRVAQLEADEELLKVAKIGTDIRIDNSRSTQIEDSIAKIEHRQATDRNQLELRTAPTLSLLSPEAKNTPAPDMKAIKSFLAGTSDKVETAQVSK